MLQREDETFEEMMQDTFYEIDQSIKDHGIEYPGCCGLICVIDKFEGKTYIRMANVGDSAGYIIGDDIIPMSEEHNTSNPQEVERIQQAGGMVYSGRVNGVIAVTRSLGDHHMKQWLVSEPFVKEVEAIASNKYVILACDGLWDGIDCNMAKEVLNNTQDADFKNVSKTLIQLAISKGSCDNITTIVLKL